MIWMIPGTCIARPTSGHGIDPHRSAAATARPCVSGDDPGAANHWIDSWHSCALTPRASRSACCQAVICALGRMWRVRKLTLAVQNAQSPSNSRTGYMRATLRRWAKSRDPPAANR